MRQTSIEFAIATPGQGLHEITREVVAWVAASGIDTGLLTLFMERASSMHIMRFSV